MASLPLRDDLVGLEPYGAPQIDVPARLNVNENPYPPPPAVVAAVADAAASAAADLNRYPDRDFPALRGALANYLNTESNLTGPARLAAANIWAGNGSNEVMLHLFQAFGGPGRAALGFAPSYSMYPEYALDTHTEWVVDKRLPEPDFGIDVAAVIDAIAETHPALVLIASPNNPTGTTTPITDIASIAEAARGNGPLQGDAKNRTDGVVVVDEAYGEFRHPGTASALTLLPDHPNLCVARTMSKAFAAAGLRLGYLAARPELVAALMLVRLPYHLSAVTQAVAEAALAHAPALMAQVADIRQERDQLQAWLLRQRSPGGRFVVAQSDANFVLFGRFADRHLVWQQLLDRGVLVREVGPPGWLRVSVGTPAENAAFRTALAAILPTAKLMRADKFEGMR